MSKRAKESNDANRNPPSHIVGIGASAGGLEALQELFEGIPPDLGCAYVVVQHLSPDFKSMMDELLSKNTSMPTHQAREGEMLEANTVYLIPAGKLLRIAEGKFFLSELPPDNRINLPINELFRTMAEDAQNHAVGIILSGTGSDGSRGVLALKEMGAMVIAQDPEEAKFDGMPVNAINTGSVDFVLKLQDIPDQLAKFVSHPLAKEANEQFRDHLAKHSSIVNDILNLIHKKTDLDFKAYKESTVSRRIEHRMSINSKNSLQEYWEYVNSTPAEIDLVKQDLLIGVTQFFRDGEVWDALYKNVIKPLVLESSNADALRVWCPGCSTGEEPYTIAILFNEAMRELGIDRKVNVFASDIDQSAVGYAATGIYPSSITSELPREILSQYFTQLSDGRYQVTKELRSMVVFATHNLIQDPPFSNMDIVTCRNTLIYLQTAAQQKVMAFFHFALKVEGYLLLGTAESPGSLSNYFETSDPRNRIYQKVRDIKVPVATMTTAPQLKQREYSPRAIPQFLSMANKRVEASRTIHPIGRQLLMDEYVPPTLVTDDKLKVVYTYGDTTLFTRKTMPGQVTNYLADMLAEEISGQAVSAAHQAVREGQSVLIKSFYTHDEESWSLRCNAFYEEGQSEQYLAVSFLKSDEKPSPRSDVEYEAELSSDSRIKELDSALADCQRMYRESLEELDLTSEELQSSNEELMAANEELQSTNEELQSVNEELYTVNSEYQQKIDELTDVNHDLENLMSATDQAVLFIRQDLSIRRYTTALSKYVNIIEFDIGRDFRDLSFRSPISSIEEMVMQVNSGGDAQHKHFKSDKQSISVQVLPYQIGTNQPGVIVIINEHPSSGD